MRIYTNKKIRFQVFGYVLIELVVVLLVIAILSSMVMPSFFKEIQRQHQEMQAGQVMPVVIHGSSSYDPQASVVRHTEPKKNEGSMMQSRQESWSESEQNKQQSLIDQSIAIIRPDHDGIMNADTVQTNEAMVVNELIKKMPSSDQDIVNIDKNIQQAIDEP